MDKESLEEQLRREVEALEMDVDHMYVLRSSSISPLLSFCHSPFTPQEPDQATTKKTKGKSWRASARTRSVLPNKRTPELTCILHSQPLRSCCKRHHSPIVVIFWVFANPSTKFFFFFRSGLFFFLLLWRWSGCVREQGRVGGWIMKLSLFI